MDKIAYAVVLADLECRREGIDIAIRIIRQDLAERQCERARIAAALWKAPSDAPASPQRPGERA